MTVSSLRPSVLQYDAIRFLFSIIWHCANHVDERLKVPGYWYQLYHSCIANHVQIPSTPQPPWSCPVGLDSPRGHTLPGIPSFATVWSNFLETYTRCTRTIPRDLEEAYSPWRLKMKRNPSQFETRLPLSQHILWWMYWLSLEGWVLILQRRYILGQIASNKFITRTRPSR